MYYTRGGAQSIHDQLVELGVPSTDVSIEETPSGSAATAGRTQERGFWASLFAPGEDHRADTEGISRGGYLLAARVQPGLEDQAVKVLDNSGAAKLDRTCERNGVLS